MTVAAVTAAHSAWRVSWAGGPGAGRIAVRADRRRLELPTKQTRVCDLPVDRDVALLVID